MNCNFIKKQEERPVVTSITLQPSKLKRLAFKALEKGYNSRNELISSILTNWLETEEEQASA